jgi:Acyltransferase family
MRNQLDLVNTKKSITRDIRFDILKTIGIFSIILAHTIPHNILFHLRNFDVPLMVIVSGALFYYSSYNKDYSLFTYLQRRIPRLIAPVWLFLSFLFISSYVIFYFVGKDFPFSIQEHIVGSFLLLEGIGYVWIIRVFIIVAIISTLVLDLYRNCRGNNHFFAVLIGSYTCYELALQLLANIKIENSFVLSLIQNYLMFIIPYGCLFGLGIALPRMKRKSILVVSGIFFIAFLLITGYSYYTQGVILLAQDFKYPPRFYYLSYGIFMSMLAFIIVDIFTKDHVFSQQNPVIKFITFISASTLWIYLWHICFLFMKQFIEQIKPNFFKSYIISFLIITFLSVLTTYIQKASISKVIQKTKFGNKNSEILSTLFLK